MAESLAAGVHAQSLLLMRAVADAAEDHAGQVERSGMSGNAENGSHLAGVGHMWGLARMFGDVSGACVVLGCSAGAGSHLRCFCVEQVAASHGTCFAVSPAASPAVYLATPAPPHQEPFCGPRFRLPWTAIPYGRAGFSRTKRVLMISWCGKEGFPVPNEDKVQYFRRYSASSTKSIPMIK